MMEASVEQPADLLETCSIELDKFMKNELKLEDFESVQLEEWTYRGESKTLEWKRYDITSEDASGAEQPAYYHGTIMSRLPGIKESGWKLECFGYRSRTCARKGEVWIADWPTALWYCGLEKSGIGSSYIAVLEVTPSSCRSEKGKNDTLGPGCQG